MMNSRNPIWYCLLICLFFQQKATAQISATVTAHGTTCGFNNGTAQAIPSGAGPVYTYTWSGGTPVGPNNDSVTGLASGPYSVTVASNGNSTVQNFNIAASATFSILDTNITQPSCGRSNGGITTPTSGNSTTTLIKNGVVVHNGSNIITGLDTGTYMAIAYSQNGVCTDTVRNIVLTDNSVFPVISNIAVVADSCYRRIGSIIVSFNSCPGCTYAWSYSATNHTDTAKALHGGIDTFSVSMGGCRVDTAIVVPGPTGKLSDSLRIHDDHCGQGKGSAMIVTKGGSAPLTYRWNIGAFAGDSISNLTGDTNLLAIITDFYGCIDSAKGRIVSTGAPGGSLSRPDTICSLESNGSITVNPRGSGPFTYHWSGGQTTQTATGLGAGGVTVTVTDAFGCDTIIHGAIPSYIPSTRFVASPPGIFPGQSSHLVITASMPVRDVQWSPYIPGSSGNTSMYVSPDSSTTYTVIITYGQACLLYDTATVTVVKDTTPETAKMVVPNTFTPNDDGVNDVFKLLSTHDVSTFHIWIYDRWGNKMYESTDEYFQWDGTNYNAGNEPLSSGVFAYVIEYVTVSKGDKRIVGGNISMVK